MPEESSRGSEEANRDALNGRENATSKGEERKDVASNGYMLLYNVARERSSGSVFSVCESNILERRLT